MRTPNCKCMICEKPLYRRPSDQLKFRHFACFEHRGIAQKITGITDKQKESLGIGQKMKGNGRLGIPHKEETKKKMAVSMGRFCKQNPEIMKARGAKIRGKNHYMWNDGVSKMCQSIRQMNEYRIWADAVKMRDGGCTNCAATEKLEAHHIVPFSELIAKNEIKNRDDARACGDLWDTENGKALCQICHFKEHGRSFKNQ